MKNLRFTGMAIRNCTFVGKYTGCRFGRELEDQVADIRGLRFLRCGPVHLRDFRDGADVGTMCWPPWPHIVVTDLPHCAWLRLKLPDKMRIVQQVLGNEDSLSRAVSLGAVLGYHFLRSSFRRDSSCFLGFRR